MGALGERSKGQVLAYVAAVVLVAIAGVRYLSGGDDHEAEPVAVDTNAVADGAVETGTEGGRLYVHVAGAVEREGLYRLPAGARVGAAIQRAGGTTPAAELSGVNLAAELQDGQQILVPRRGEAPPLSVTGSPPATGSATSPTGAGAPAAPISLAQATPEQLDATVDGIGPILATRIIEFRDEQGGVDSIEELREVDGIGDERLADLREALVP